MDEGRRRHDWDLKSSELCQRSNLHTGKRRKPEELNPLREKKNEYVDAKTFFAAMRGAFSAKKYPS